MMGRPPTISRLALSDIESLLEWSHVNFGEPAAARYAALVIQAIHDVAENPERRGSTARPDTGDSVRTYHLRHSRSRVAPGIGRVRNPRHFIIYRAHSSEQVEIIRILHDQMNIPRHLHEEPAS